MGENEEGVYHAVARDSLLNGALGKIQVRWGSLEADWNWCAMSVLASKRDHFQECTMQKKSFQKGFLTNPTIGIIIVAM